MIATTAQGNEVETGHQAMIHDAQLDFYSRRLATCSSDRTIKIFAVLLTYIRTYLLCSLLQFGSKLLSLFHPFPFFSRCVHFKSCYWGNRLYPVLQNQWKLYPNQSLRRLLKNLSYTLFQSVLILTLGLLWFF